MSERTQQESVVQSGGGAPTPTVTEMFVSHADGVYTLGVRMLRDRAGAEDVVQDTFLTIIRQIGSFRGEGSLSGWIYRIAYRKAIEQIRRRRDHPTDPAELPDSGDRRPSTEDQVLGRELAQILDRAIIGLTEEERAAFVLRDIEGLSTEDTARALDIGLSATKMRLSRARNHLRVELKEYI